MTIAPIPNLFELSAEELEQLVESWSWPRFRARQIEKWVFQKGVLDPGRMTDLPAAVRQDLAQHLSFSMPEVKANQLSRDGTHKLLLVWPDGEGGGAEAETVMIPDGERRTACVSSQVGCPVGCRFCASGVAGLKQNLTAGRIIQQVYALNQALAGRRDPVGRITNLVYMGMGEPLSNYNHVIKSARLLHDPQRFNMGWRRITLSTVGVPPRIRQLADEGHPMNLALSLHAPEEELRRKIIPWAEHFELNAILEACKYYFQKTGREITFEYILLAGLNDQPKHAKRLATICRTGGFRVNINLIRYNEVAGLPFARPESDAVVAFQNILREAGINTHVRKSRGRDIDAACGQLRRKQSAPDVPELVRLGAK